MYKNIILKQKLEKERLVSLSYVDRDKKSEADKWLKTDLIKVVLGPRRAGKSAFIFTLLSQKPFIYFNFDDEQLDYLRLDHDLFMQQLKSIYGEAPFIFFDEIQNLPNWELFVNRLHRAGYNLILTGSNAHLLSGELATALTGRHIPIEIMPFSFSEFLRAKQYQNSDSLLILSHLDQFMTQGGYPEIVIKNFDLPEYLSTLFDSILFKDIVKRHKIRFAPQLDMLSSYLINQVSCLYSLRKITRALRFKSSITIEKYLQYLIDSYLIFSLSRYSYKSSSRLVSPRKIYAVDNGFITAKAIAHSPNLGVLFENLVFLELIKSGLSPHRDLFYYQTRNGREVDFIIKKNNVITNLIQVAYSLIDSDVEKREVKALAEAGEELNCKDLIIITWNEEKNIVYKNFQIKIIPFWHWLKNEKNQ
jgi:predicted AAA+ superfamily ATPase